MDVIDHETFQNPFNRYDVNRDTKASTLDALVIINKMAQISNTGVKPVQEIGHEDTTRFFDVNGNGEITAVEALQVINFVGSQSTAASEELAQIRDFVKDDVDEKRRLLSEHHIDLMFALWD
jgi:Dockerin type I domain